MMKFRVEPRDVPPQYAARLLGLTLLEFNEKLSRLIGRGFPAADVDTGNFDLAAINRWQDERNSHLFGGQKMQGFDARTVAKDRIAKMREGM